MGKEIFIRKHMTTKQFIILLKQIHNGKTCALNEIFYEYYKKMKITANFILKNNVDAEDAASNVIHKIFIMALNNETFNIENVGAYINKAIKNECFNIYNERKGKISLDSIKDLTDNGINEDRIFAKQDSYLLLSKLSERDREIVMLFYFYDYKISYISKELNIPEGTIKWILRKSINYLKNELKK